MALTKEEIYQNAIAARKDAQEKLSGKGGLSGVENTWIAAQEKYKHRNDSGVFTKQVIEEYNRAKADYIKASKELDDAKAKETTAKKAFDDSTVASKAQAAQEAAQKKVTDAAAAVEKANSLVPSRGAQQAQDAATALKTAQDALGKLNNPKTSTSTSDTNTPDWSIYSSDPKNGITDASGKQVVFVANKKIDGTIEYTPFNNMNQAVAEFMKSYATTQTQKFLQDSLIAKHYIKSSQINDGTWTNGIQDLLLSYSVKLVNDGKYALNAQAITPIEFLNTQSAFGSGTGASKQYQTITTRGDAKKELDSYLTDLVGRASTPQEESNYYAKLHAAEQKAVRTESNGTSTGSELAPTDHLLLAADVAKASLKGTDAEKLLTTGSRAATDIAALQQYAASYGIQMPAAEALKYVAAGIGQTDYIKKQEERIRQTSIVLHPQLKDHILAGGTVSDIADQYAYAKKQKLGVAVPVSTTDKDVMDAVSKGISVSDFNRQLQADPRWRTTDEAHNVAADFANTILTSFGFGGN